MLLLFLSLAIAPQLNTEPLNVLFIGDRGSHQPVQRLDDVYGKLIRAGVAVDYEDDVTVLDLGVLRKYDTIVMYANQAQHSKVPIEFMQALTRYVRGGGGFVGLHCTSGCFTESGSWLKFIGARFESHGSEVFTQTVVGDPELLKGWSNFTAWDETYVQTHVDDDRTILTMRGDEPWSWIRNVGKGRLFYSASGHDARVWSTDGFFDMLLRAIVYTSGDDAQLKEYPKFEYDVHDWVPNYEERNPQDLMQRASTPQQAEESLVVPAGMHAELFACEPMVVNPIAMTWDERGRCWVVESPGYPATRDAGDRISILEDTDGDGRADKKTIFADGLNLPTSLLKVDGGVLVTQAPDLLFLKDTNADDLCDEHQVLFSGFGTWDTHAGPANLRWGLDNYIWGTVGYSSYTSEAGSFGSGLWRWKPGLEHPEFMAQFSNNTWGIDFTSKGEIWGSAANNAPSFFVGIPSQALAKPVFESPKVHPALPKIRQGDFFGNFTAATSHSFATGDQFPEWWNEKSAFICEPTAHLISRQETYADGSGFRTRDCFNVVSSVDDWFCPVQVDVGPDGALWVADFSQFIILHNLPGNPERGLPEIDFDAGNAHLNPLRDRSHGRIFRIVRDGATAQPEFDLGGANADEVLPALYSTNKFWRVTARRLLVEQEMFGASGILHTMVRKYLSKGATGELAGQEALRVLHGFDSYDDSYGTGFDTVNQIFASQQQAFGVVALDMMPRNTKFSQLLSDSDLIFSDDKNMQRHALLAAAEMQPSYAIAEDLLIAAKGLDREDAWLPDVLKIAIKTHSDQFSELAAAEAEDETELALQPQRLFAETFAPETYSGTGEFTRDGEVLIIESEDGADCAYQVSVPVIGGYQYRYQGWVKTEKLSHEGDTHGALLNIHPKHIVSEYVVEDSDWTLVTVDFETAVDQLTVTLNCLYGGWGQSTGTAYYRDLSLTAVAPANSLSAYLKFAQQQPPQNLIGDATRGKDVYENNAANCMSCHPGVGPDLAAIGQRLTAAEIKQAIINPSASRAEGWEDNPAVMPQALNFLSAQDVADLVEYLTENTHSH
jgi:putative membrane-bound dehydrogenase-like protein